MAGTEITVLLWQGFLPFPLSCPCGGGYKYRAATAQQRPCITGSI
nr:MAG TPA: Kti11, Kti13 transfer, tRNA modification, Complex [Caudoviricetes sp.]DAZ80265.1 MAG TPA: Kti11, Kti13 transfer, tRNA modification, Complex [Caudoviricetes sp.]